MKTVEYLAEKLKEKEKELREKEEKVKERIKKIMELSPRWEIRVPVNENIYYKVYKNGYVEYCEEYINEYDAEDILITEATISLLSEIKDFERKLIDAIINEYEKEIKLIEDLINKIEENWGV